MIILSTNINIKELLTNAEQNQLIIFLDNNPVQRKGPGTPGSHGSPDISASVGTPGSSSTHGSPGISASVGTPGSPGTHGSPGISGSVGTPGSSGTHGSSGS